MAGLLDGVDQRTNLVGENRLELLMFTLGGQQRFGLNVFKVQEVIQCPDVTKIAKAHPHVIGLTNIRGKTIAVIDLAMAIGKQPLRDTENSFLIITEFNRSVQGFLVDGVDRIINLNWEEIKSPPSGLGKDCYMTAVTRVDDEMVEIIDVEKVFAELGGVKDELSEGAMQVDKDEDRIIRIMIVDDSSVARNQIKRTMDKLGMESMLAKNGREGLDMLKDMTKDGSNIMQHLDAIISDVEMPEMDGYTLTTEIRTDERLADVPLLLHTSLSGVFNKSMVQKVGADRFVPKFNAEELANEIKDLLKEKGLL